MSKTEQPRTRGRPKDPVKREAVIDAARSLFIEHGLDGATMDQVVSQSGVSRATVWSNFPDKANLVEAVLARESERMIGLTLDLDRTGVDLKQVLVSFGETLLRFLYDPEMMAFERIIGSASRSYPQFAPRFYEAGPGRHFATLTRIIVDAQKEGTLIAANAEQAASDLIGLWQGTQRAQTLFGQTPHPDDAERRRRVLHGVRQFMRLYGRS